MRRTAEILRRLGEAVYRHRKRAGLSQEKLGFKTDLHRTYISEVERGKRNLRVENLYRIADALGVRPRDLLP